MTTPHSLSAARAAPALQVWFTREDAGTWLRLDGEADRSSLRDLDAALVDLPLDHPCWVEVDLTGLTFADAAAVRMLVSFATRLRRDGYAVRAAGARPVVRRLAAVMGVEHDLGLA